MSREDTKESRINILKQTQEARKQDSLQRVYQAIERLQKIDAKVNFQAIAKEANVSVSYLYKYPELKRHIAEVRSKQNSMPITPSSKPNSSATGKIITKLRERIQQLSRWSKIKYYIKSSRELGKSMPVFLRVRLTEAKRKELNKIKNEPNTPLRTQLRIETLMLSNQGLSVKQIAHYLRQNETTGRRTIGRWLNQDKEGLFDQVRTGRPKKWQDEDIEYLESCLEREERTYNSQQLAQKLKEERQIELSPQRIRKILKKKDWKWKRTKTSLKPKKEEKLIKKADLSTLKIYQELDLIKLKYLDEAGFCLWSPVSYSYVKKGEQKEIKQTKKRGKRVSILGIFSQGESFEYGLKLGSFKNKTSIKMLDWQAEKAEKYFQETGKITVIVLDNYTVHKSKDVKKHEEKWREKGLEFFFIAAYSPELNLIETEWHQLKTHELAGRMFDDEYDLAMAVIEGIENRQVRNNCSCERFRFN